MPRVLLCVTVLSSWAIVEVPAGAQPALAQPVGMSEPAPAPGFTVIDRIDGQSSLGFETSYLEPHIEDGVMANKPTVLRFAAHFRYVDPGSGIGGYAQLPFAYGSESSGTDSITITDVGSLELGGVYAPKLSVPGLGIILHAGLALPTGEPRNEFVLGTAASSAALPELYNALPRALTGKLGVSAVLHRDKVFARLDLGVDDNFSNNADGNGDVHVSIARAYHVNAGVGIDLGAAALMLESANVVLGAENGQGGATLSDLAVAVRFAGRVASPYVAVVVPIEDDISGVIDFAITAGVDFKL